jgi:hypothetical protein
MASGIDVLLRIPGSKVDGKNRGYDVTETLLI